MTIWTIPIAGTIAVILAFLALGLVSRKVQRVAYNIAEYLANKEGSGVPKGSVGGFCSRITPKWAKAMVWVSSFAALALMVYVGMRFGWPWAFGYVVGDHLLKSVEIPVFPSIDKSFDMIKKQAEKSAPTRVVTEIEAFRDSYEHL